jgi:hypothetical protein
MIRNSQIREAYEASARGTRKYNLVCADGTNIFSGKNRVNPKQRPTHPQTRLVSQPRR